MDPAPLVAPPGGRAAASAGFTTANAAHARGGPRSPDLATDPDEMWTPLDYQVRAPRWREHPPDAGARGY